MSWEPASPPMVESPVLLTHQLDIVLPSGESYRLRPGPYGKGIAVAAIPSEAPRIATHSTGKRGRKPRASTVALREKLARDVASDRLADNRHYVKWIMQRDDTISLAVARQVVYRERQRHT